MQRFCQVAKPTPRCLLALRVMGQLGALCLAAVVVACRPQAQPEIKPDPKPAVSESPVAEPVSMPAPKPEDNMPLQQVSATSRIPLPPNFPSDVPVYPGSVVRSSSRAPQNRSAQIQYKAPAQLKDVATFYQDAGKQAGWLVEDTGGGEAERRLVLSKESRRMEVILTVEAGGTACRLVLGH